MIEREEKTMEKISKQFVSEYQASSLIEFLLGDSIHSGWLDKQSHDLSLGPAPASRNGSKANLVWHDSQ